MPNDIIHERLQRSETRHLHRSAARRRFAAGLLMVAGGLVTPVAAAPRQDPVYPPFGLDLTARDLGTRAGDDFFQWANGAYLARIVIPADKVMESRRNEMTDRTEAQLHTLLDEMARAAPLAATTPQGQVGAYYAAFMDTETLERIGNRAIEPELLAIRQASSRAALAALMGQSNSDFYPSPFTASIDNDLKRPDRYAIYLGQSNLGLPDRDYYLEAKFAPQRDKYKGYATGLLSLIKWPDAPAAAERVIAFETQLAQAGWTRTQQRDPTVQYNPVTPVALANLAPDFAWKEFLGGAGLSAKTTLVVKEKSAFPKLARLIAETPVETLKAWMAFRVADNAAPYLSRNFLEARFAMRDQALAGQVRQRPRWRLGLEAVAAGDCYRCTGTLKWPAGQLYVERYFPPETKTQITNLAQNIKASFRDRLVALDWMAPATKAEALKKLDTFVMKVGYPDQWRDYSRVTIRRGDLVGDVRAILKEDWAFGVRRSDGPVDRAEWLLAPQMNNAYSGALNDIVFPAAILQAPMFDAAADPAINYGAIGAVIGHELTHGFDDEGRSTDATGALRDWWAPADAETFKARAAMLGAQYGAYEPAPGVHIKPEVTMGENIADLGGLSIALDAYHKSLNGKPAPVLNGLTGEQRVFLGWAQVWAGKATAEEIVRLTTSDEHSYRKYRVNGVVRNIDAWYVAFGIRPGDALYIPPEKRVRIW